MALAIRISGSSLGAVPVLFDTRGLESPDRAESWSDAHEEIFFPIGVRFASKAQARGRIEAHGIGPIGAYRVASDASVVSRNHAGIRASDPEQFLVAMPLRGRSVIEQGERMSVFGRGDFSSWDSSHPFEVTHTEAFDLLLIVVPIELLGPKRDRIRNQTAGKISRGSTMATIAAPFFRQLWSALDDDDPAHIGGDLADGVVALVRALHAADPADGAGGRLPTSVLLSQMKAYVDQHLADPTLGPESIARAHYISTRYVHKLFARDEISVSEWIRHRRLEACRRDLRDPELAHETISQIARGWALSNPAHFSRIFREAYGCTPSEVRSEPQTAA
jgi:AraC-like DNA-binding protein